MIPMQYALNAPLTHLACASEILFLALAELPPRLVRIDLSAPDADEFIELPFPPVPPTQRSSQKVRRLFLDPTGRHLLVSISTGDLLYFFDGFQSEAASGRRRARLLQKFRGTFVDAVAWSKRPPSASSSGDILIGTSDARILEAVIDGDSDSSSKAFGKASHDRHHRLILTLPEEQAIRGLYYHTWQTNPGAKTRGVIIAATQTRIYQYIGILSRPESPFGAFIQTYREFAPKMLELPGDVANSELWLWPSVPRDSKNADSAPLLAWLSGPGVYHGSLSFAAQDAGDSVIESAKLVPYPTERAVEAADTTSTHQCPLSMTLTEHHIVLLYAKTLRIIRRLDDRLVYEEDLPLSPGERMQKITADAVQGTYWLHSSCCIYELTCHEEDRDIWAVYLDRQAFQSALNHVKDASQRDKVVAAKADFLFGQGHFVQAAELYAQSSRPFESVVLRLVGEDERDALRNYLHHTLDRLPKAQTVQRTMLATWLLEISLGRLTQLEDAALADEGTDETQNLQVERTMIEGDIRDLLQSQKAILQRHTTYDLLVNHGRPELLLYYAAAIGDAQRAVAQYISVRQWEAALAYLAGQPDAEVLYTFASPLLHHVPKACIDFCVRLANLDPVRLLPALLAMPQPREAARFLQHAIFSLHNTNPLVHNALLSILVRDTDETKLLQFLSAAPQESMTGEVFYDTDFALRICRSHGRVFATNLLYSKIGLHERSVDLALQHRKVELAKESANRVDDNDILRKQLWLKIAQFVVGRGKDVKGAVDFLEDADILKIEDILPLFPDFVVIDDFKEEICAALENYSRHIELLRQEMTDATQGAAALKVDLDSLSRRFIIVDIAEACMICGLSMSSRQFYVFACHHGFHAECLIAEVTQHLSPRKLRRLIHLQSQLSAPNLQAHLASTERSRFTEALAAPVQSLALAGHGFEQLRKLIIPDALVGGIIRSTRALTPKGIVPSSANGAISTADAKPDGPILRQELEELLASSCVLCDLSISSLDRSFVNEGEVDI